MWDDLATQFQKKMIEQLKPPVIIAVSSCKVSRFNDFQLTATPTTHYYINPVIPEADQTRDAYKQKYSLNPPFQICKYPHKDPEMEKKRNQETLYTLLQQNPASFKGVRFTCEAMITSIKMNREWHYTSCNQCTKKVTTHNECEDHGQQEQPTYRYNFKAIITDGTADAQFIFFTPAGDKVTGHPCSELAHKYKEADPRDIPIEILNTKGQKYIF